MLALKKGLCPSVSKKGVFVSKPLLDIDGHTWTQMDTKNMNIIPQKTVKQLINKYIKNLCPCVHRVQLNFSFLQSG